MKDVSPHVYTMTAVNERTTAAEKFLSTPVWLRIEIARYDNIILSIKNKTVEYYRSAHILIAYHNIL